MNIIEKTSIDCSIYDIFNFLILIQRKENMGDLIQYRDPGEILFEWFWFKNLGDLHRDIA